jgi:hypothetical protein
MSMSVNLYKWRSAALANYGKGYIIVQAKTVDGARQRALMQYDRYLRDRYYYYFNSDGTISDQDDRRTIEEYVARFTQDISVDPEIIDPGIILIEGSE